MTLGSRLKRARSEMGMSLRQVEKATQISNGYLSLLETGQRIRQPSPNLLKRLAEVYGIEYAELMELAGYIMPTPSSPHSFANATTARFTSAALRSSARVRTDSSNSVTDLTPDERSKVDEFIAFLRSRRSPPANPAKRDESGGDRETNSR